MLEKRGKLSLDDDVRRWIPEMPDYGAPIRIRDLLQHTSGLRDYGALAVLSGRHASSMSEFLGLMASQRDLNFKPGTQHEYSHSDYMLLGLIVERSAGEPFGQHLRRHVLEPLGMKGSFVNDGGIQGSRDRAFGHFVSDAGVRTGFPASQTFGGANLYASVEDLAGWDRNFDDPTVGGRDIIGRMVGRPVLQNGDTIPYAYGLRLGRYRGLRTVSRGGSSGGTRTEIIRFPDHKFTVAVLCNADNLEQGKLAQGVADIYLGSQMQASRTTSAGVVPAEVRLTSQQLARYAGMYRPREQPWNLLPVEMRNGVLSEVLFHEEGGDTLIAMTPAGDGRFFEIGLTGNVGVFTFRPETGPSPTILEISWNDEVPEVLERVPDSAVWRPSAAVLAEYAGIWFSHDLDASWHLESRSGKLVLRRPGHRGLALLPVKRDQFVRGFGSWMSLLHARLDFQRDKTGRLTHFTVSTAPGEDSARGVRFVRIDRD